MSSPSATFDAGSPRISGPIRRFARHLGPLARPMAGRGWLPLYAVLHHTGRTSSRVYATPVVALRIPEGFIIPLPFGDATQWAKNLFAAGGGSLRWAGRDYRIAEPNVIDRADDRAALPRVVRFLSARLGLRQFVLVRTESAQDGASRPGV
jgi:deazaflavin-dependent oxidoreductase (nitroreductase family)